MQAVRPPEQDIRDLRRYVDADGFLEAVLHQIVALLLFNAIEHHGVTVLYLFLQTLQRFLRRHTFRHFIQVFSSRDLPEQVFLIFQITDHQQPLGRKQSVEHPVRDLIQDHDHHKIHRARQQHRPHNRKRENAECYDNLHIHDCIGNQSAQRLRQDQLSFPVIGIFGPPIQVHKNDQIQHIKPNHHPMALVFKRRNHSYIVYLKPDISKNNRFN